MRIRINVINAGTAKKTFRPKVDICSIPANIVNIDKAFPSPIPLSLIKKSRVHSAVTTLLGSPVDVSAENGKVHRCSFPRGMKLQSQCFRCRSFMHNRNSAVFCASNPNSTCDQLAEGVSIVFLFFLHS